MKFYNDTGFALYLEDTNTHLGEMYANLREVAKSHPTKLHMKHISGNPALYVMATSKPFRKLTKMEFKLWESIKNLFCIEGENSTLENLLHFNRIGQGEDLETFAVLLNATCLKFTKLEDLKNVARK